MEEWSISESEKLCGGSSANWTDFVVDVGGPRDAVVSVGAMKDSAVVGGGPNGADVFGGG
jgi:hypothetical protein